MPHDTRRVGDIEIVVLCDGVTNDDGTADESFPGASPEAWTETRERYPGVFEGDAWRLHVHASLLRVGGRTILVDTGIGPETAPAFAWTGIRGSLDRELADAGVDAADVDVVVITHVHDDHLGWNVDAGSGRPRFENARYLLHRADLDAISRSEDEDDRAIYEATIRPLERLGALDVTEDAVEVMDGVLVRPAPGHTPGHQVVAIDSNGERAMVTADTFNNPVMLLQPGVNGTTDGDPELAARTRAAIVEEIGREALLVVPSHFPEPFGRLVRDGDHHLWVPEPSSGGLG